MHKKIKAEISDSLFAFNENNVGNFSMKTIFELNMIIEESKIEAAVKKLIEIFPIFQCCLKQKSWRDHWVLASSESLAKIVSYHALTEDEIYPGEHGLSNKYQNELYQSIDVSKEPPMKMQFYQTEKRILGIIVVHHAVTDGTGMKGLIKIFCELLSEEMGGAKAKTRSAKKRGFSNLIFSIKIKEIPKIFRQTTLESKQPNKQNETGPITSLAIPSYADDAKMILSKHIIYPADFQKIKEYVKKHQFTINDYMIAVLIRLSRELGKQVKNHSEFIGIALMVDLRRYMSNRDVILGNFPGTHSILLENSHDLDDFNICVRKVHEQVAKAKNEYIGLGFALIPAAMFSVLPASSLRKNMLKWSEKFIKGWSNRMIQTANDGILDTCFEAFGEKLKYAAIVGPFSKDALPSVTISTCKDTLTIFFTQMVQDESAGQKQLDYIGELLTDILLEGPTQNNHQT